MAPAAGRLSASLLTWASMHLAPPMVGPITPPDPRSPIPRSRRRLSKQNYNTFEFFSSGDTSLARNMSLGVSTDY